MKSVEKVQRLELFLPKQKWTKIETLIFIQNMYWKSMKTEAIFTNTEMNYEWRVNSLQNGSLDNQPTYSTEFSIGWSTSESLCFGEKLCFHISFNIFHVLKILLLRWIFGLGNNHKNLLGHEGFITIKLLEKCTTVNSASYGQLLKQYFTLFIEWPSYIFLTVALF